MRYALGLLVVAPLTLALCSCAAPSSPEKHGGADAHAGAPAAAALAESEEMEDGVALSSVPDTVLEAGRGAVSGISFSSAEREVEGGETRYSLIGTANGHKYEVEVTAAGKVVEVEDGDCDECEDGEDK